jgi:hypothetical protein
MSDNEMVSNGGSHLIYLEHKDRSQTPGAPSTFRAERCDGDKRR